MDNSDILINVINECVEKALQKSNIPTKTMGTVTYVTDDNNRARVQIGGFDTSFELINKSGEFLSEGDSVFVESIGGNLTNGFISERFGSGYTKPVEFPVNRYITSGGAINMNNSDIINANAIYMNDESGTGEGIAFLKQSGDNTNSDDYEFLRGYRDRLYYNNKTIPYTDELFYKVNDVEYAGINICAGHVTSSATQIIFMFFPPKNMHNISNVSVTAGTITVRGTAGYVQDSYSNPIKLSGGGHTVSALKRNDGAIMVTVTKGGGSAWSNVTNNTPVSVQTSGFNLKFT